MLDGNYLNDLFVTVRNQDGKMLKHSLDVRRVWPSKHRVQDTVLVHSTF